MAPAIGFLGLIVDWRTEFARFTGISEENVGFFFGDADGDIVFLDPSDDLLFGLEELYLI